MTWIQLIVLIALIWFVVWVITNIVPMEQPGKKVITVVALVATVFIVLEAFGLLPGGFTSATVPRFR